MDKAKVLNVLTKKRFFFFSLFSFFFLFFILNSCQSARPIIHPTHFAQNVMTIDYHVIVGDRVSPSQTRYIQHVIDSTFQEINDIYNKWNPHSELSQLNNLEAHTPFSLSPQLNQFLQRINQLVKLSNGLFDPTIEPIQQLWITQLKQGTCPTAEQIETLKPCIGWHTLHIENGIFSKKDRRTKLDLGGVAKGYCVDLIIERLHQIGLNNLYVEWGGEIRTLGFHPSKRPWRVFISRLTNPDPSQAIAEVDLIDRALATSGDYFQYWEILNEHGEKIVYCHIFNPLTLMPLQIKRGSIASTSLLALDCTTADALAKILMLFDSTEEAQAWLEQMQMQFPYLACWIVTRD